MVIAVVNSSGLAFIVGATDAIAVPPQTAVPEAKRKESFWFTPSNLPRNKTDPNAIKTKNEIQRKKSVLVSYIVVKLKLPPKKTIPVCKILEPYFFV